MRVAAIVPAFNEAGRIGAVLSILEKTQGLDEIIVVDDGSTDETFAEVPRENGIRAVRMKRNSGKGAALLAGVKASRAEVLVFVDADLVRLESRHIENLLKPVLNGEADMTTAVFRGGRWRTDWSQRLVPYISGQRALRRDFFLSLRGLEEARFGIETALTWEAKRRALRIKKVPWEGVTHVMKEEKLGLGRGLVERAKMYWQIGVYLSHAIRKNGSSNSCAPEAPDSSSTEEKRKEPR